MPSSRPYVRRSSLDKQHALRTPLGFPPMQSGAVPPVVQIPAKTGLRATFPLKPGAPKACQAALVDSRATIHMASSQSARRPLARSQSPSNRASRPTVHVTMSQSPERLKRHVTGEAPVTPSRPVVHLSRHKSPNRSTVQLPNSNSTSNLALPGNITLPASNISVPASNITLPVSNVSLPASTVNMQASSISVPASSISVPASNASNISMAAGNVSMPARNISLPASNPSVAMPGASLSLPASSITITPAEVPGTASAPTPAFGRARVARAESRGELTVQVVRSESRGDRASDRSRSPSSPAWEAASVASTWHGASSAPMPGSSASVLRMSLPTLGRNQPPVSGSIRNRSPPRWIHGTGHVPSPVPIQRRLLAWEKPCAEMARQSTIQEDGYQPSAASGSPPRPRRVLTTHHPQLHPASSLAERVAVQEDFLNRMDLLVQLRNALCEARESCSMGSRAGRKVQEAVIRTQGARVKAPGAGVEHERRETVIRPSYVVEQGLRKPQQFGMQYESVTPLNDSRSSWTTVDLHQPETETGTPPVAPMPRDIPKSWSSQQTCKKVPSQTPTSKTYAIATTVACNGEALATENASPGSAAFAAPSSSFPNLAALSAAVPTEYMTAGGIFLESSPTGMVSANALTGGATATDREPRRESDAGSNTSVRFVLPEDAQVVDVDEISRTAEYVPSDLPMDYDTGADAYSFADSAENCKESTAAFTHENCTGVDGVCHNEDYFSGNRDRAFTFAQEYQETSHENTIPDRPALAVQRFVPMYRGEILHTLLESPADESQEIDTMKELLAIPTNGRHHDGDPAKEAELRNVLFSKLRECKGCDDCRTIPEDHVPAAQHFVALPGKDNLVCTLLDPLAEQSQEFALVKKWIEAATAGNDAGVMLANRNQIAATNGHNAVERLVPEHSEGTSVSDLQDLQDSRSASLSEDSQKAEAALQVGVRSLGFYTLEVAQSSSEMGSMMHSRGKFQDAEALFRQALVIREQALGTMHHSVAIDCDKLGQLLQDCGQLQEAAKFLRRSLEISECVLEPGHRSIAVRSSNLGLLLKAQGDSREAEPLLRRALIILKEAEANDSDIAIACGNLGQVLTGLGQLDEAERLLRHALTVHERNPEEPEFAMQCTSLAQLLKARGEFSKAEILLRCALKATEHSLGPQHPVMATRYTNLSKLLFIREKYEEAQKLQDMAASLTMER